MTKIIRNIQTTIPGEGIGSLVVIWDLEIEKEVPSNRHEDDPSNFQEETRRVDKIRSVEFQVYDKVGIFITSAFLNDKKLMGLLENDLLTEVENEEYESEFSKVMQAEPFDLFKQLGEYFNPENVPAKFR